MTRNRSRRAVLAGTGAAVAGLVGIGSQAAADGHDVPVVIESVTPDQDLIVLRNEGESTVDLSDYIVDWLYNSPDYDQSDSLPSGTEIEAGGELRVTSGYYDTDADVTYDYGAGRIDNEGTNVIALYTPSRSDAVSVYDTSTGETEPGDPVDDEEGEEPETEEPEDGEEDVEEEPDEPESEDEEQEDEREKTEEKSDESEPESEDEEAAEREEDDCPEEEKEKKEPEPEDDDCPEEQKNEPEPEDDDCPDEEETERSEKKEDDSGKETDESERTEDDC